MELWDRAPSPLTRRYAQDLRQWAQIIAVLFLIALVVFDSFAPNRPVERASELDNFFYGSIGADIGRGLPVKVLQVLPATFPEHLPAGAPRDLTAFGFIHEPGERLPIGFSIRRQLIDLAALNCGTCHTGTVRAEPGGEPMHVAGMPANTLDLQAYFRFLFDVAADEDFTPAVVLGAMAERDLLSPLDRLIYPAVVRRMKEGLLAQERRVARFFHSDYPRFGPGRVNTFDTFKTDQFRYYYERHDIAREPREMYGIVDMPSVWNQAPRDGLWLHWDGNQASVRERNFSAAIGAGARPHDMDVDNMLRIEAWLNELPPPSYPFAIDRAQARRGEQIFRDYCYDCHAFKGERIAQVQSLAVIGTDPHRAWSYTEAMLEAQQDYTAGYFWQFERFRVTDGYSSHPLDGIWARAPYLHNGSVPTMWALLTPADRPVAFETGVTVYDQEDMGFRTEHLRPAGDTYTREDGTVYDGRHFVFDTRRIANGNDGHAGPAYGTELSGADKRALIEYLKTK